MIFIKLCVHRAGSNPSKHLCAPGAVSLCGFAGSGADICKAVTLAPGVMGVSCGRNGMSGK
jgi:hypothetical protein